MNMHSEVRRFVEQLNKLDGVLGGKIDLLETRQGMLGDILPVRIAKTLLQETRVIRRRLQLIGLPVERDECKPPDLREVPLVSVIPENLPGPAGKRPALETAEQNET